MPYTAIDDSLLGVSAGSAKAVLRMTDMLLQFKLQLHEIMQVLLLLQHACVQCAKYFVFRPEHRLIVRIKIMLKNQTSSRFAAQLQLMIEVNDVCMRRT